MLAKFRTRPPLLTEALAGPAAVTSLVGEEGVVSPRASSGAVAAVVAATRGAGFIMWDVAATSGAADVASRGAGHESREISAAALADVGVERLHADSSSVFVVDI